jgi:capsular polysaccharide biosynthesis protein
MKEEELNLVDYWRIIRKRRKIILTITLLVVLAASINYLIKPKLYESESTVQLAVVGGKFLFTQAEAKSIIESSIIVDPVLDSLFKEGRRPSVSSFKNHLEVEIVYEQIGKSPQVVLPFLRIRVKATDPVISQKMTLAVTNEWMDYIGKEFDVQKGLILSQYNDSRDPIWDEIRVDSYQSRLEYLQERIKQTQENIAAYKVQVAELESQIRSAPLSGASGIAEISLLTSILSDYRARLTNEQERLVSLEKQLKQENLNFEEKTLEVESSREDRQRRFTELFLYMKEPAIIDYPEVPTKSITPGIKYDLFIGLGLGLLISISVAFILEWSKKTQIRR